MTSTSSTHVGLVITRIAAALGLIWAGFLVLRPFVVPIVWAGILAYVTWPLFHWLVGHAGRPGWIAALLTGTLLVVAGIPVAWLLAALASEASQVISGLRSWLEAGTPLPEWLIGLPWLGSHLDLLRERAVSHSSQVASGLAGFGRALSERLVGIAGGLARNLFTFLIALITLFVFYVNGERILGQLRRWASLAFPEAGEALLQQVGTVLRAVVFGLVGTALVQGILAGIGLAIFGVPSAVAFGALTAVLSFVPAGPVLVWGGAAAWLFMAGSTGAAIGMSLWGALLISSVDNVLRPILISRSGAQEIPFLVVFFGVLGGLAAFGLIGLFLGPVLLSLGFTLLARPPVDRSSSAAVNR